MTLTRRRKLGRMVLVVALLMMVAVPSAQAGVTHRAAAVADTRFAVQQWPPAPTRVDEQKREELQCSNPEECAERERNDLTLGPIYAILTPEYSFATLAEMAATSDLVVRGTVTGSSQGRSVNQWQYTDFQVAITDVRYGQTGVSTLRVEQITGLVDHKRPLVVAEQVPLQQGAEYTIFLSRSERSATPSGGRTSDTPRYYLTSPQGVYVGVDGRVVDTGRVDALSESFEGVPAAHFDALLSAELARVARGEVAPLGP